MATFVQKKQKLQDEIQAKLGGYQQQGTAASADLAKQQADEAALQAKKQGLATDLYGQADQYDTARQQALGAMQEQTQNSDMEARRMAAESMALASGGSRGGGSAYGQLLQTGRQAGDDSRQYMDRRAAETQAFNLSSLADIAQMRNAAAGTDIEAMQSQLDYGTATQRADKAFAALQPQIQSMIDTAGGDGKKAAGNLRGFAMTVADPLVAQKINMQADQLQGA